MAQRAGLIAVAVAQLAITVPLLILGHDHDAGAHAAHELGSFDLALAIAFAVGAVRPALSAGLAWPCGIAAAALAGTAIADLIGGQTFGADEAQHLIAVAGAALLCLAGPDQPLRERGAGRGRPTGTRRTRAAAARADACCAADRPPDSPGGEVARPPAAQSAPAAGGTGRRRRRRTGRRQRDGHRRDRPDA